jgi:hypothetical protein
VGTAPPRHLIVGLKPNFFATRSPVMCAGEILADRSSTAQPSRLASSASAGAGEILTGRTLFISLPLCRVLRVDELASIIGHELASRLQAGERAGLHDRTVDTGAVQHVELAKNGRLDRTVYRATTTRAGTVRNVPADSLASP